MAMIRFSRESLSNVYLFYGEESYKKRIYRDSLKKAVIGDNEMNYSYFEGNSINFANVYDSVVTLPFFAEKRLVVVENSGKFKGKGAKGSDSGQESAQGSVEDNAPEAGSSADDMLLKILEALPETTCLAFFEESVAKNKKAFKRIKEKGQVIECAPDAKEDVVAWMAKGFAKAGKKIRRSTILLIIDRVGVDYDRLRMEYEKIIGYTGSRPEVTDDDVCAVTLADIESRIFDMLEAMSRRDVKKVLEKYADLLANQESPFYILAMMRIQFRTLLETAELRNKGYSTGDVARLLKKRDFIIRNAENCLHAGLKMKDVRAILEEISDTDRRIKMGEITDRIGVETLLVRIST